MQKFLRNSLNFILILLIILHNTAIISKNRNLLCKSKNTKTEVYRKKIATTKIDTVDPIDKELEAISNWSGEELVYVPQQVSNVIELICKNIPASMVNSELKCVNEAGSNAVPTVTSGCAIEAIKNAHKILKSPRCSIAPQQIAEFSECLEQYKKNIDSKDALIWVQQDQTRSRRRCKVFCRLLVRDFLDTRDLAVAGCLRARSILATGDACIQGNLLVRGNLKVEGQICGLTSVRGATGAAGAPGAIGQTGPCECPTGVTGPTGATGDRGASGIGLFTECPENDARTVFGRIFTGAQGSGSSGSGPGFTWISVDSGQGFFNVVVTYTTPFPNDLYTVIAAHENRSEIRITSMTPDTTTFSVDSVIETGDFFDFMAISCL